MLMLKVANTSWYIAIKVINDISKTWYFLSEVAQG